MMSFRFHDDILEGMTIKVNIREEDSLSHIISECVKRVLNIFEQLGLYNLIEKVKNKHFRLSNSIHEFVDSNETYKIISYEG